MRGFETLLFWLMALAGGLALAPCLILPAWFDYQATLIRLQAAEKLTRGQEAQLENLRKEIEHRKTDQGYLMRLAQEEFGSSIKTPTADTIFIGPTPDGLVALPGFGPAEEPAPAEADVLPELSAFIQQVVLKYPHAGWFLHSYTRPVLMGAGGLLLVTAVGLLGGAGVGRR